MPKKTNTKINNKSYYRVTATIGHNADGSPIRKQFYGDSKKDAEAKRDEYMEHINKGLSVGFDKMTFGAAFAAWFEDVLRPSVSLTSYVRYENDYRLRIRDCELSGLRLVDVKSIHVQRYYNGLAAVYSVCAVRLVHKLIRSFFNYCVKADMIMKSPLYAVELPSDKRQSDTNTALRDEDIAKFQGAARDDISNFIYVFALFTGMRQGEILALTFKDVDLDNNMIHVNKTIKHLMLEGQYKPVLSETKTQSSIRAVPILDAISGLLRVHMRQEKEKCLRLGMRWTKDSLLFSSSSGTYREATNLRRALSRLCQRYGIQETTFHSLRHTFCTILAKQNVPLKTASMLMGHSNVAITAKIYTHVDNAELRRGIEKLSVYFN